MKRSEWALVAAVLGLGPIGCSNTVEGLKRDAKENKVEERTEKAAQAVAHAVHEAGREVRVHALALEIRAALVADKRVEARRISVEVDDQAHVVALKGSVPSGAQAAQAEAIARQKAKGYRVRNLLRVGPLGGESRLSSPTATPSGWAAGRG